MINHRIDGRYDDLWGPALLCLLLVIALIVSYSWIEYESVDINPLPPSFIRSISICDSSNLNRNNTSTIVTVCFFFFFNK